MYFSPRSVTSRVVNSGLCVLMFNFFGLKLRFFHFFLYYARFAVKKSLFICELDNKNWDMTVGWVER